MAFSRSSDDARRKAAQSFAKSEQRDSAFWREKKRIDDANFEKTARLKALRLAKEAKEREEAALNPPPEKKKRARKAAAVPDGPASADQASPAAAEAADKR